MVADGEAVGMMGRGMIPKMIKKEWEEGLDKVVSISDKSLGSEGSMSKVGISPRHNSDKLHAPVASNYHTMP